MQILYLKCKIFKYHTWGKTVCKYCGWDLYKPQMYWPDKKHLKEHNRIIAENNRKENQNL